MGSRTWKKTALPSEKTAVPRILEFKRKNCENEVVCCYEVRLVSKGSTRKGVKYPESFLSVARFEVLLLLMGSLVSKGWNVHHVDIAIALVNGDIDDKLYIICGDVVCKLQKKLYGLKQSSKI